MFAAAFPVTTNSGGSVDFGAAPCGSSKRGTGALPRFAAARGGRSCNNGGCGPSTSVIALCAQISSLDRKSTRLNSSHRTISYAVFCLKKKKENQDDSRFQNVDMYLGRILHLFAIDFLDICVRFIFVRCKFVTHHGYVFSDLCDTVVRS